MGDPWKLLSDERLESRQPGEAHGIQVNWGPEHLGYWSWIEQGSWAYECAKWGISIENWFPRLHDDSWMYHKYLSKVFPGHELYLEPLWCAIQENPFS